jgi:hypothetical protein
MRRDLVINWAKCHEALKLALNNGVKSPFEVMDTDKGWSYVTFFQPGTTPSRVLFNIDNLEDTAQSNGFFLPWEVVATHNKVVVTAVSELPSPSAQLFGLHRVMEAYAALYANPSKHPQHSFYGKLGGCYDRPEKGRVLVIYSTGDDALLQIEESLQGLLPKLGVRGVEFSIRLANGLSDIPRMLQGFDDPLYRSSGTNMYRITDPAKFSVLLNQARHDYAHYLFEAQA